jgi:hypothetical protein
VGHDIGQWYSRRLRQWGGQLWGQWGSRKLRQSGGHLLGSGAVGDLGKGCGQRDSQGQIQLDYEVVGRGTVRLPGSGTYEQFAKWGRRWIVHLV